MSSVCYVFVDHVYPLSCLVFVCLRFVVSSVCMSSVCDGTDLQSIKVGQKFWQGDALSLTIGPIFLPYHTHLLSALQTGADTRILVEGENGEIFGSSIFCGSTAVLRSIL